MSSAIVSNVLRTPIARLVRALAPTRIVLFGSYAKGSFNASSDIDLLVIAEAADDPAFVRRARQLVARSFPPIDLVLCTPLDADLAGQARSPFLQSILERGVTVYASSKTDARYPVSG